MIDNLTLRPPDWQARADALDPTRSFIVQAPAGSGKTELLTQRILTLLGQSDRPEDVLAITFTRKAAHEMRSRLLDALQQAAGGDPVSDPHRQLGRQLALQVLEQDRLRNWNLLQNPSRLQILTIDSLCAALVRRMPWLSRFGSTPQISEDAAPLYRLAANRMVERIRIKGPGSDQVTQLLRHLDARVDVLRNLLADMLSKRDQWLRHLLNPDQSPREVLEQGLHSYITAHLQSLQTTLPPELVAGLRATLKFASNNLQQSQLNTLDWFATTNELPGALPDLLPHWQGLADLLLTRSGTPRKRANKNQGFPADKSEQSVAMKQQFEALLELLAGLPELCWQLDMVRRLPQPTYTEAEWRLIEALVCLLPLSVVELDALFREQGTVDFIAVAGAARAALGDDEAPEDLLLQLDQQLQHILIDEFQDTAFGQYLLLQQLTAGWQPGDGRSLFVVGDPMQSIYRFREADVGLFLRARRSGIGQFKLEPLQLTANFRSGRNLVDWFNQSFVQLFPQREDEARGAVSFAPAAAVRPTAPAAVIECLALTQRDDQLEAALIVEKIIALQEARPEEKIGILVRSRSHAAATVAALQQAGLRFQAREIVSLKQRSVIQDLLALTQALLQPGHRVAWLSVLRAPWCGLTLAELLEKIGRDSSRPVIDLLCSHERQVDLFSQFSASREDRLQQVVSCLKDGLARRGRVTLRALVESTWLSLGGPACCSPAELADATQFYRLLERLDQGGDLSSLQVLDSALDTLYAAPDPLANDLLQVMTIHKAKGLEFDTVMIPGLGRTTRGNDKALLRWLEHPDHQLLLAPIPAADGSGEGATYAAIGTLLKEKVDLEMVRLLYVAVTRAKRSLFLFGHLQQLADGDSRPASGSLLAAGWDALSSQAVELVVDVTTAADPEFVKLRCLRRLPEDYQLPSWQVLPEYLHPQSRSASQLEAHAEGQFSLDLPIAARAIGETVHAWLERHAGYPEGAGMLPLDGYLKKQLLKRGIAQDKLEEAMTKSLICINNTIAGNRGSWLLQPQRDQANELALTGLINDQLVQAKIDRTFIDEDNIRWVIDYKTSTPASGQSLENFYVQQAKRYAVQLLSYRQLMQAVDSQHEIKMALYFPAFDGWYELEPYD